MASLKKNLGYQTVNQILNTCLPLVTSPYLSRTLGATQQGVFSYTLSVVNYFTLVALLGVSSYGTRSIAECQKNRRDAGKTFGEIYALQAFTSLLAIAAYCVFLASVPQNHPKIAAIQMVYLLGALTDINWLFFGLELFELTVKRNIIIKLTVMSLILICVKRPEDLWLYALIMSGSNLLTNLVLWLFLPRSIEVRAAVHIHMRDILRRVKPNLILFVPSIAFSVFHVMDKTMLGIFSTYEQVGFYYNADKVVNIPYGIISGISAVLLPRTSSMIGSGKTGEADALFRHSFELSVALCAAVGFGIAAISPDFTPLFFGSGFEPCIVLIEVFAPIILIKGLSVLARMNYLVPHKLEPIFIQSVFLAAFVNVLCNYFLIRRYGALGAVLGTLIAEIVCLLWQYWKMRRKIVLRRSYLRSVPYLILGAGMFAVVRLLASVLHGGILSIMLEILCGVVFYALGCLILLKLQKNSALRFFLKMHET